MEKKFETPEVEIVELHDEVDIITTSYIPGENETPDW